MVNAKAKGAVNRGRAGDVALVRLNWWQRLLCLNREQEIEVWEPWVTDELKARFYTTLADLAEVKKPKRKSRLPKKGAEGFELSDQPRPDPPPASTPQFKRSSE